MAISANVNVRFNEKQRRYVEAQAKKRGITVSDFIRECVDQSATVLRPIVRIGGTVIPLNDLARAEIDYEREG